MSTDPTARVRELLDQYDTPRMPAPQNCSAIGIPRMALHSPSSRQTLARWTSLTVIYVSSRRVSRQLWPTSESSRVTTSRP